MTTSSSPVIPTNVKIPVENLTRQWQQIGPEVMDAVQRVLPAGKYTLGPELAAFETEFAAFVGTRYAVGISSGTAALHLGLLAVGVGPGDEVITVPNTYIATVFAITYCGATPVFVDIDPDTYNLDPAQIEAKITPRTRAILPVHLYGQVSNMEAIAAIARRHNLKIVEDDAHTHGATRHGQYAGSFGDVGCFSFYPTKVMGAFGDGGLCTTNDPAIYEKIRQLRYMGQRTKYNHEIVGYQERLDELQAAMLRVKLRYLNDWIAKRQHVAEMYDELLTGLPVHTPKVETGNSHVYYLYTIRAERRDALKDYLIEHGVGCYVVYPYLVPETGAYQALGVGRQSTPRAARYVDEILCLPMFPELTDGEIREVADTVRRFYA
ncbi:MAG TPA: DegT/DnrJ/EryC1/StrS family aminotransferase [Aggregatilineales bacterium]|nr:DegT/DnrJ/EryC1/StrS family aminotransferase [Aggregatilineales bacterium]